MPLPTFGGIAAVPSTVDVYVNNIKTFSQDVAPGPFSIANIPLITGAGNAQLVVTEFVGRRDQDDRPVFRLGEPVEPGADAAGRWKADCRVSTTARRPTITFETPVGSATLRRGIFDWMTAESHVEAGAGVANGGVGAVVRTGAIGVVSASLAASDYSAKRGAQASASYQAQLFGLSFSASSQRTFGDYNDLVSATARLQPPSRQRLCLPRCSPTPQPPKALDTITISAPLPFDPKSSVSANFIHSLAASGTLSEIVSASYSRSLPYERVGVRDHFSRLRNQRKHRRFRRAQLPLGRFGVRLVGLFQGKRRRRR